MNECFSNIVRLQLITSNRKYRLGSIGPDTIRFVNPQRIPPDTRGKIIMRMSGGSYRQTWRVRLPCGADGTEALIEEIPVKEVYNPTAEQIAEATAAIRAEWSEETERDRRCRQNREPDYGRTVRVMPETE